MNKNIVGANTCRDNSGADREKKKGIDETLEFVSLMVHDLQGPIASMKTLTKFLSSGKYNSENDIHAALVRSTKNALERTEAIIHDLLESANDGNLGLHLNPAKFDLREIVTNSVSALGGSALDYGVPICTELPDKPAFAQVDKYYLLRAVDNIVYNALKHSPTGKHITAAVENIGDDYIISVRDQGVGLEGIDTESLFNKYQQVSLKNDGKYRGIGLGLYFCRLAITAMGGKIWAEPNPGAGACFKIALRASRGE
jgi:two-component system phosphate regulon sensor histidine kinase PhoR